MESRNEEEGSDVGLVLQGRFLSSLGAANTPVIEVEIEVEIKTKAEMIITWSCQKTGPGR